MPDNIEQNEARTEQVNVRFRKDILKEIDHIVSEERYNNRSEVIRRAVREWLANESEKKKLPKERDSSFKSR